MIPLRIAFATSEITPFAKTGGLADVSAALPIRLHRAGHDVRPFVPLYSTIEIDAWGTIGRRNGKLVFTVEGALAAGVPLPRSVVAGLVAAAPNGRLEEGRAPEGGIPTAEFSVPWPNGIGAIWVSEKLLLLEVVEPILERTVDGSGGE